MTATVAIYSLDEARRIVVRLAPNVDGWLRYVVIITLANRDARGDALFALGDALGEVAQSALFPGPHVPREEAFALAVQAGELRELRRLLSMEGTRRMLPPRWSASA